MVYRFHFTPIERGAYRNILRKICNYLTVSAVKLPQKEVFVYLPLDMIR